VLFLTSFPNDDTLKVESSIHYLSQGVGMAENYIEVTKDNFAEKVLQATQLTVVLFWAEQSGACQIQVPEFEVISREYQNRITFTRLNVTNHEELTSQWNVEGIPTMIFFKGGKEIYRITGIVMRQKLRRQIEGLLLTE
jgi:thioredoxin 1